MKLHAVLGLCALLVEQSTSTFLRSTKAPNVGAASSLLKDASGNQTEKLKSLKEHDDSWQREPTLYFLFMARDGLPHKTIWEHFFRSGATGHNFRALVHCKNKEACQHDLVNHPIFSLIDTVDTEYCFGLVNAMNQLLRLALDTGTGHRYDKFIFVSETTLPVKPFQFVYQHLASDDESDFCFFPVHWLRWPEYTSPWKFFMSWLVAVEDELFPLKHTGKERLAPKHHQWMVLSRRHAKRAVRRAEMFPRLLSDLPVNYPGGASGCSDEFWHFNTLYEGVNVSDLTAASLVHLKGIAGGDLHYDAHEPQGQCDTFVYWQSQDDGQTGAGKSLGHMLEADTLTLLSHKAGHPCEITRMGEDSIRALRKSPFLFARKIMPGSLVQKAAATGSLSEVSSLEDAFDRFVFADP